MRQLAPHLKKLALNLWWRLVSGQARRDFGTSLYILSQVHCEQPSCGPRMICQTQQMSSTCRHTIVRSIQTWMNAVLRSSLHAQWEFHSLDLPLGRLQSLNYCGGCLGGQRLRWFRGGWEPLKMWKCHFFLNESKNLATLV